MHAIGRFLDANPKSSSHSRNVARYRTQAQQQMPQQHRLPKRPQDFRQKHLALLFVLAADNLLCQIAGLFIGSHFNIIPSMDTIERMATRHLRRNSKDVHQKLHVRSDRHEPTQRQALSQRAWSFYSLNPRLAA